MVFAEDCLDRDSALWTGPQQVFEGGPPGSGSAVCGLPLWMGKGDGALGAGGAERPEHADAGLAQNASS